MKFRLLLSLIMLAVAAAVMVSAPGESQALNPNHQCSFCHSMHNSPGGMLNTAAQFDLVCDTCHGPAGTQKFVDRHVDPNNVPATWDLGCNTCHTPHSDLPNRYNFPPYVTITGDLHPHTDSSDAGGDVAGVNIKLMGRDEDGTGIAKVRTPLRILSEGSAGPCTNSNTEIEVALPPFADGDGPPHTVMVGDRISFSNAGTDFTGSYRVKETNWDNWPSQGWVCFDHPNAPVTTSGGGYLHSGGWGDKPLVATGSWNGGSATLFISGDHGIEIDDWITVMGVTPVGYNGRYQATAATPNSVTYVVADPGGTGSGGEIEFVGSVKEIQGAAIQGPPPLPPFTVTNATWVAQGGGRAVLTFDRTHPFSVDDTVTVTGIVSANNPAGTDNQGYNGTFVINQIPDNLSIRIEP